MVGMAGGTMAGMTAGALIMLGAGASIITHGASIIITHGATLASAVLITNGHVVTICLTSNPAPVPNLIVSALAQAKDVISPSATVLLGRHFR